MRLPLFVFAALALVASPLRAGSPFAVLPSPAVELTADTDVNALASFAGGVVVGGRFTLVEHDLHAGLVRLDADGRVDPSFDDTCAAFSGPCQPTGLVASESSLYLSGSFVRSGVSRDFALAKLGANGQVDDAWRPPLGLATVWRMHVQGDKLVVLGKFFRTGTTQPIARRYDAVGVGAVDATYGVDLPGEDIVYGVEADVLGHVFVLHRDGAPGAPIRLSKYDGATGLPVAGFAEATFASTDVPAPMLHVASLDRLFIAGTLDSAPLGELHAFDAATGIRVAAWSPQVDRPVTALAIDGADLLAAACASPCNYSQRVANDLLRIPLSASGATPAPTATRSAARVQALLPTPTGVLAGSWGVSGADGGDSALVRLDASGAVDQSYAGDVRASGAVAGIAKSGDDLYLAGGFNRVDDLRQSTLVRIRNGEPDATWRPVLDNGATALALDGNKLYVAGAFEHAEGRAVGGLLRYDIAGPLVLDAWDPGPGSGVGIVAMHADGQGGLYLRGRLYDRTYCGGPLRSWLLRITTSEACTFDAAFAPEQDYAFMPPAWAFDTAANAIYLNISGGTGNFVRRLRADTGAMVAGWQPDVQQQPGALALAGGWLYVSYLQSASPGPANVGVRRIAATTGVVDAGWLGAPRTVAGALAVDAAGWLYVSGSPWPASGAPASLSRLSLATGAPDPTWGAVADTPFLFSLLPLGDDTVLLGGDLRTIDGHVRTGFAAYGRSPLLFRDSFE